MTRSTEEVAAYTSKLIEDFVHCDTAISKRIAHRSKLLFDIIEYVRIINTALFSWRDATDAYLKEQNLGSVRIDINKEQPIFSEGDDFLPKHFPIILGAMTVDIKGKTPFSLKAPVHFTRNYGRFIWESGRVGLFYSECHLARNHEKFGNQDLFDLLSLFGSKDIYIGGQLQVLRHPGDVINEELYQRLSDHLITHLRD